MAEINIDRGVIVTEIKSDPKYVASSEFPEGAGKHVGMLVSVNGVEAVLIFPEDVLHELGHAIETGHLPR